MAIVLSPYKPCLASLPALFVGVVNVFVFCTFYCIHLSSAPRESLPACISLRLPGIQYGTRNANTIKPYVVRNWGQKQEEKDGCNKSVQPFYPSANV